MTIEPPVPSPATASAEGPQLNAAPSLRERVRVRVPMHVALPPEYLAFVRQLRRDQTDPEKLLWYSVRSRQLCGLKFRRQYPLGPYILDFYCHQYKLCIELDGGQHYESAGIQHDTQRQVFLTSHGVHTLRFSNSDVLQHLEEVLLQVAEATRTLTPTLSRRERE
jgi:very-short-patch-repair endonuclease